MVSDALILCFYFISLVDVSQINGKAVCSRKYDMYWSGFYPIIHVHLFIISGYLLPPPPPVMFPLFMLRTLTFAIYYKNQMHLITNQMLMRVLNLQQRFRPSSQLFVMLSITFLKICFKTLSNDSVLY